MIELIYGAITGFVEVSVCHPLDTIKTRIQNREGNRKVSLLKTCHNIYTKNGLKGFYYGLTAVYSGVIPKNAVRFYSYTNYNSYLNNNFFSGLLAGFTEAILVVNPLEVCKIRIQTQYNSTRNVDTPIKYKNVFQTAILIIRNEGIRPLYAGLTATVLRQGINQATNFYFFHKIRDTTELNAFVTGCISSSIGPLFNNPLDVIKTKLQSSEKKQNPLMVFQKILATEGIFGFYKGLIPRLARIVPGQGITFGVYDYLKKNRVFM